MAHKVEDILNKFWKPVVAKEEAAELFFEGITAKVMVGRHGKAGDTAEATETPVTDILTEIEPVTTAETKKPVTAAVEAPKVPKKKNGKVPPEVV